MRRVRLLTHRMSTRRKRNNLPWGGGKVGARFGGPFLFRSLATQVQSQVVFGLGRVYLVFSIQCVCGVIGVNGVVSVFTSSRDLLQSPDANGLDHHWTVQAGGSCQRRFPSFVCVPGVVEGSSNEDHLRPVSPLLGITGSCVVRIASGDQTGSLMESPCWKIEWVR